MTEIPEPFKLIKPIEPTENVFIRFENPSADKAERIKETEAYELKPLEKLNLEFQAGIIPSSQPEPFELIKSIEKSIELIDPRKLIKSAQLENAVIAESETLKMPDVEIYPKDILQTQPDIRQKLKKGQKKQRSIFALISDMLFYLAIFTVLVAILTSAPVNGSGSAKMVMGYSYFTVLTRSMQDEIPKGSFILVKQTDPQDLNIGDNITFMKDANTSVTHKIADIYENYEDSGVRGFQTKGVNNPYPDKDIVYESNIIGKVILVLPSVGAAISYIRANIYIVFIIFGLCILLSFLLRGLFGKSSKSSGYSNSDGPFDNGPDDKQSDSFDSFDRNELEKLPKKT